MIGKESWGLYDTVLMIGDDLSRMHEGTDNAKEQIDEQ